jgi:hypothetical protein
LKVQGCKLKAGTFNFRLATFNRFRAGDGIRTREYQLGRLTPYRLATPAGEFCGLIILAFGALSKADCSKIARLFQAPKFRNANYANDPGRE